MSRKRRSREDARLRLAYLAAAIGLVKAVVDLVVTLAKLLDR